jgi:serine/threonine-protein kinase
MIGSLFEGKYRIIRLIGEGGMGVVYEAEHILIGRQLAVKLLHPEYAHQAEIVERFAREARAATAIRHANIIEVTDMGVTPTGQPFLVMELLEGTSLRRLVEPGKTMPQPRLVDVMDQVLDALDAAHQRRIVHRDLKPDNIFLIRHAGRDDFVKVLDFGISKFLGSLGGGVSTTRTGSVMGTPQYMSPEQAMGRKDVDHRADLWAVGVMLYEAATGRAPYLGDNYNEMLSSILMSSPPAPRAVLPSVSPALEQVILKALMRPIEHRYQSAVEFREAVLKLKHPPIVVAPADYRADADVPRPAVFPVVSPITLTPGAHELPSDIPPLRSRRPWYIAGGVAALALVGVVAFLSFRSGGGDESSAGMTTPAVGTPVPTTATQGLVAPNLPAAAVQPAATPVATPTPPLTPTPTVPPVTITPVVAPMAAPVAPTPSPPPVATPSPPLERPRDAGVRRPPDTRDGGGSTAVAVRPADAGSRPVADAGTVAPPATPTAPPDAGSTPAPRDVGRRDARSLMTQYEEPATPSTDAGHRTLQTDYH